MPDQLVDPNGRPPHFDGVAWVSEDGGYWWNGTAWQPLVRRRETPWGVVVGVVVIIVAAALVIYTQRSHLTIDTSAYGATNARIDGPGAIEFDYRAQDACNNLTFIYTFYNQQGIKVSEFEDQQPRSVAASQTYHFVITIGGNGQGFDPSATRFTVTPNCHG